MVEEEDEEIGESQIRQTQKCLSNSPLYKISHLRILLKCRSDSRIWDSAFYPVPEWCKLWISCWSVDHTLVKKTSCPVSTWLLRTDPQRVKKLWGKEADDPEVLGNTGPQLLKLNVFLPQQFNKFKILYYELTVKESYLSASQCMFRQYQNRTRNSLQNAFGNGRTDWSLTCVVTHEALIMYQSLMPDS